MREASPPGTRVLHLLGQRPEQTGSGIYLQALVRQLAAQGWPQKIVAGVPEGFVLPDWEGFRPQDFHPVVFGGPKLSFPVVGMSDVMPYPSTRWSQLDRNMLEAYLEAFALVLRPVVDSFRPQVIHSHHLWLVSALARRLFPDLRVVASCHGTGLRQLRNWPHFAPFIAPALRELDVVLALTGEQKSSIETLLGIPGRSISVVGAGYRSDLFCRGEEPPVKGRAVYAGKLSRSKGVLWLLEAAEPLVREGRLELELAGGGVGEEAEQVRLRASQMGNGVRLLGRLEQAQLCAHFQRAELFVLPSFYEGLPLVLIEALACGCRVVTTALPGVVDWLPPELVESGWVHLVELPPMLGPDQPDERGLPAFVQRFRTAVDKALATGSRDPGPVERALEENSWQGVVQRILAGY